MPKLCLPLRLPKLLALGLGLLPLWMGLGAPRLGAMPPPTPEMVKKYRADGTLERRIAFAKKIGNHRVDPTLTRDAQIRLQKLANQEGAFGAILPTPPLVDRGMPTKGTPKMFILLLDFADIPAASVNTPEAIYARVFGDGDGVQAAPYESLKAFYYRSSYGQLTLTGNVLAYYHVPRNRATVPQTDAGRQALIKEALDWHVSQGHDFSQYDNNGSGKIDYFAVLWTGADNGWAEFWWAYQTRWNNTSDKVSGKSLSKYVWQWASNASQGDRSAPNFDPKTLLHETGHALGLPDYYDYDTNLGPDGGLGGLDMMDSAEGDHNCFSKFLLDWITPTVYTNSVSGKTLYSSGDTKDNNSIIVMDTDPGGNFGEYFMAQNRHRVGNDLNAGYPADGLLVWHVDSRLNAGNTDYLYDNSYAAHKLLRLMEADGLEQIEKGRSANAGDYWTTGKNFGPASVASSNRYDGSVTKMGINNISAAATTMTVDVYRVTDTTPPTGAPSTPTATTTLDTIKFTWTVGTAADVESSIAGYRLQVGTTPGGHEVLDSRVGNILTYTLADAGSLDGVTLYGRVLAMNGAALESAYSGNSAGLAISLPVFSASVLDNSNCTFKTIGPWTTDTGTSHYGGSSARSAVIGDNASTYLQTRITGPGTFDFYWRVSCEAPESPTVFYDNLAVSIDGVLKKQIGGEAGWVKETYAIPAGTHVIRWTYSKDPNTVGGSDAGWVDYVIWTPAANASATVSPSTYTTIPGGTVSYAATLTGATLNSAAWTTSAGGTFSAPTTASGVSTTLTSGTTPGTFSVTATPADSGAVAGTASLTLVAPTSVTVGVTGAASVMVGDPVTFTAAVSFLTDKRVTWAMDGGTFGTQTDTTTAWSSASAGTFHITATSAVATGQSSSATVTVVDPAGITISVDHPTATLLPGATQALVGTTSLGTINWTLPAGQGSLSAASGTTSTYSAPAPTLVLADLTATVTLTNSVNAAKTATSVITVKTFNVNADPVLDLQDILALARDWGTTASRSRLSGGATVGAADLTLLLSALGL